MKNLGFCIKMICKYCNEEMQDFTKSFVCCFNNDCPHRDLPAEKREGGKTRGYCIEKQEEIIK